MSVTKTIALADFTASGGQCAPDQLKKEIEDAQQAELIGKVLIGDPEVGFTDVDLEFSDTLDANETTALDSIVAAHTAEGLPGEGLSADGHLIVAPTFEHTGMDPVWKGFLYAPTPKGASEDPVTSMFDEPITTEIRLRGGWYSQATNSAELGDVIEFSVVDKDDVLGLFALYGLTVGVDVLELKKFVQSEHITPAEVLGTEHPFVSKGGFKLAAGLYFRTTYVSTGAGAPKIKVKILYVE